MFFRDMKALAGLMRMLQDKIRDLEQQTEDASLVTKLANAYLARVMDWTEQAKKSSIDQKSSGEVV